MNITTLLSDHTQLMRNRRKQNGARGFSGKVIIQPTKDALAAASSAYDEDAGDSHPNFVLWTEASAEPQLQSSLPALPLFSGEISDRS